MELLYRSTRGAKEPVTASKAILQGLAEDGGLFVPDSIPKLTCSMEQLAGMTYQETAYEVMKLFLTDYTEEELKYCINSAYDKKFDTDVIAPLAKVEDAYYLELFHGATIAFKDMALSILPYLMTTAAKKNQVKNDIVILTATSGDTGKAALEGFADVPGTKIIVFYPKNGVSPIQEKQMVTQKGNNTYVVGITGNFDDAQTGVKKLFADKDFNKRMADKGYVLSSANSINFGRLAPQIAYYFFGYLQLVASGVIKMGGKINVTVPTGNFGNILAAYYAKRMGLPINKLICASNKNNVLTDFFDSGRYVVTNRTFFRTMSPSMDILISSNLERLLFELMGRDSMKVAETMKRLKFSGEYVIDMSMVNEMKEEFYADFCDDQRTSRTIRTVFDRYKYLMDPHTAVAQCVYENYVNVSKDETPTLLVSTASPYKFVQDVLEALTGRREEDPFAAARKVSEISKTSMPAQIAELENAEIVHKSVVDKENMGKAVEAIAGGEEI